MHYKTILATALIGFAISACDQGDAAATKDSTSDKKETSAATVANGDLKVAYINSDSLFTRYKLFTDLEEEFIQEKMVAENAFRTEVAAFEKDYRDAQEGASQLSEEALQILGMKLQQREQDLMARKQQMEGQLLQSEQLKNDKLYEQLRVFLDEYAAAEGYHMIYGYNGYGDVLYMDSQFDITDQVIDALNEAYEAEEDTASE